MPHATAPWRRSSIESNGELLTRRESRSHAEAQGRALPTESPRTSLGHESPCGDAASVQDAQKGLTMRFRIVLVLIIAGIGGLGWYRGWFHLSSDRGADKSNVTLTVDKD